MINADLLTDLILKMNAFRMKKGHDTGIRQGLIRAINNFIGEDSLDMIYVNSESNILIPDVFVMPIYNKDFGSFLTDPKLSNNCPYGYTIEMKEDAFENFSAEELTAAVIHHILQNVQSACAKARFLNAYTKAIEKFSDADILELYKDISHSEVCYLAYLDICSRPLNVPVSFEDYVGTDDVLKSIGLADAFDSYLVKTRSISNDTPEDVIECEVKKDFKTIHIILESIVNRDIAHYYEMITTTCPLITFRMLSGNKSSDSILGFASRQRKYTGRYPDVKSAEPVTALAESVMNPQNEIELRFQIDKIITEMRYLETEGERSAILFRIKQLHLKLVKTKMEIDKRLKKTPGDRNLMEKSMYVDACIKELDMLRMKVVEKPVTPKHYGVFVQYPAGYEY